MNRQNGRRALGTGLFFAGSVALATALIQAVPESEKRSVVVAVSALVPTITLVYAVTDVVLHHQPPEWVRQWRKLATVAWCFGLVLVTYWVWQLAVPERKVSVGLALIGAVLGWIAAAALLLSNVAIQLDAGVEAQPSPIISPNEKDPDFRAVIEELNRSIANLRRLSRAIFVFAGAVLFLAVAATTALSWHAVDLIMERPDDWTLFAFELVRTTAVATVLATAVWGTLNLGRAALDQSARHEKRLIAAHFLHFTLHTYQKEIRSNQMTLGEVMQFLKSWSENVESAFTSVKYGKKNDSTSIYVGRDGFGYSEGQLLPQQDQSKK